MAKNQHNFNYNEIPKGYYDIITKKNKGLRSFWHNHKFQRILDYFDQQNEAILDIGCFSGTFLGMIPKNRFSHQIGVDILQKQIDYAIEKYGKPFRKFYHVNTIREIDKLFDNGQFSCISIIEVIEHLKIEDIEDMMEIAYKKLKENGRIVITTPNYSSAWPVLEFLINKFSDVKYEEQHITHFNYFNIQKKLEALTVNFNEKFNFRIKTTTHFLTPYISVFSYGLAQKAATLIKHKNWNFPFGSLLLVILTKKQRL